MIWRPDTCECVLEYTGVPFDNNSFVRAHKTCPKHTSDPQQAHRDNQAINIAKGRKLSKPDSN